MSDLMFENGVSEGLVDCPCCGKSIDFEAQVGLHLGAPIPTSIVVCYNCRKGFAVHLFSDLPALADLIALYKKRAAEGSLDCWHERNPKA